MTDWTHAPRWRYAERWPDLCLWPSRSDWPVFHYDGRWRCSKPLHHDGDHLAMLDHNWYERVAWEGPWVPAEAWENCHHCGKPDEADGDHSCPCPSRDEECKVHV